MSTRSERIALGILLISTTVLQLSFIPQYTLKLDQSQVLYFAGDYINHGIFPVHGVLNSQHAYNPPFFVWLYILPLALIGDHGWVLTLPALTLHTLAIILLFRMGKKYFGFGVGLVAATLYAFLPNGVYFGHSSWAQGLLSPFYILIIFGISQWLLEKKSRAIAYLLPLVAWTTGMHWGGILIIGVLVLIAFFFRVKLLPSALVVGVLVSILMWAPFLRFEQSREFVDILALVRDPLPAPEAWEVTSLCEQSVVTFHPNSLGIGDIIQLRWPWFFQLYQPARKIGGDLWTTIRASMWSLGVNFHWSPFIRGIGTWQEKTIFFLGTLLFLIGLGRLMYRCWFQKNCSDAEKWLLLIFLLPAMLQNFTPKNSLARPDIAWLLYCPFAEKSSEIAN